MSRFEFAPAHPLQFQRGEGKVRTKKARRKTRPRIKQMGLAFGLTALGFFAVYEIYLFLISWKNLEVRDVQLACLNESVKAETARLARDIRWGNILLLDIAQIKARIESNPWVKEARVRKVFPSSVKIEITPRKPAALLQKDSLVLIDEEGVELKKTSREFYAHFPMFFDEDNFIEDYQNKIHLAWECLHSLSAEDRADVEMLDLTESRNVALKFWSSPTRLLLGDDLFAQKIAFYRTEKDRLENEFGPLEYANLRIPGRIYFKSPKTEADARNASGQDKEKR
jgi:cell division septal protein FtsQ